MTAIWLDYFKNCNKTARRRKLFRLPAIIPIVLHNGERRWMASHRFKQMIEKADLFGKYVVDFEYVLVSVNDLKESEIRKSNTLVDNIFLVDKKQTKEDWTNNITYQKLSFTSDKRRCPLRRKSTIRSCSCFL